jgi:hypothetical protein
MYLLTIDLYELGQYLRILLWICLPLIIISLLVTTWIHHRRRMLNPAGWQMSVGLDNGMEPDGIQPNGTQPERISHLPEDSLSYREDDPDQRTPDDHPEPIPAHNNPADNDQWGNETVTEWKGKYNIYQGILWMKAKYEQYRDQADQRYELLKEELKRSECRYQDLLLSIEENKIILPATGRQQELMTIIDDLEEQLRIERLKVEDLVARLQTNSQLLLNIYKELDKPIHIIKEAE